MNNENTETTTTQDETLADQIIKNWEITQTANTEMQNLDPNQTIQFILDLAKQGKIAPRETFESLPKEALEKLLNEITKQLEDLEIIANGIYNYRSALGKLFSKIIKKLSPPSASPEIKCLNQLIILTQFEITERDKSEEQSKK